MPDEPATPDKLRPRRRGRLPKLKRRWPFPVATVVVIMGLWVTLLGAWLAFGRPTSWRDWLANVSFRTTGTRHSGSKVGQRDQGGMKLAYLGDGKAELGQYSIKIFDPVSRATLRTDFRLEGRTACEDGNAFQQFMKRNHRFFREQVMVTVRNCGPDDLTEPSLQLLEKKVVSRVNRALGRRFLESAEIKDFFLYESVDNSVFVERDLPQ